MGEAGLSLFEMIDLSQLDFSFENRRIPVEKPVKDSPRAGRRQILGLKQYF